MTLQHSFHVRARKMNGILRNHGVECEPEALSRSAYFLDLLLAKRRTATVERISALAGVTPDGGILPPPAGSTVNRADNPWWRNQAKDGGK